MSEIMICIGLMGVGKTTFAKKFAKDNGYEYICFDNLYHGECQNDILKFNDRLRKMIKPDKNYIFDNWFKWHIDWYLDNNVDTSIEHFKTQFPSHTFKIFLMHSDIGTIKKQYHQKKDRDLSMSEEKYYHNMRVRFNKLIINIKEAFLWGK